MYRVKFIDLVERTHQSFDYENLFDAIRVAKETNIGYSRLYTEAIPNEVFNEKLFELLTLGYIYTGSKSEDYPLGSTMIMLTEADPNTRIETSVYNNIPQGTYVGSFIPTQANQPNIPNMLES